ncbi:tumor necrosis factor ligand superfamily member 14 [Pleurodeles waltl]|uniref:tumor necrosis factor ligand superfamily member 14 n=1 Tax=Pleurodeles waltl TaxID=8319 RepID=UPI00370982E5
MDPAVCYPSVFVVDRQVHPIPVVKKPKPKPSLLQTLVVLLVLLALAGLAIEAYFLRGFQEDLKALTSQLSKRVNASFEKMIQDKKWKSGKPAAHVTGAENTTSGQEALLWEPMLGDAFLYEIGYEPTKGSLVFNRAGRYYLYSKIQLGKSSCKDVDKQQSLTHRIYKTTPRYFEKIDLMMNVKPYCREGMDHWWDSSFLGGTFKLEEQDEVYVNVSKKELVRVKDGSRSYFGVFMI